MRKLMFATTAVALAVGGCNAARDEKAGPSVDRSYPVESFDRIEVDGPYEVNVTIGSSPSVRASGPGNYLENMTVMVEGGTLKIQQRKVEGLGFFRRRDQKISLQVSVPSIRAAQIAGSGGMNIDKVSGEDFKGVVAGSGDLKLGRVEVRSISVGVAGSGGVVAAGKARRAEYENTGSGDIDASGLAATDASVSVGGSGGVSAQASGTVDVDISGAGDVHVTGGAKCVLSKAGPGNAHCA